MVRVSGSPTVERVFLMRVKVLRTGGVAALAAASAVVLAVGPASAGTSAGDGSAYGARASVSLLPGVIGKTGLTVDTGKIAASSTSGPTSAAVVRVPMKGVVTAKSISSSSKHDDSTGDVKSKASIVGARLDLLASLAGKAPTASVIKSECTSTADGITGDASLVNVDLGKLGKLPVHPDENTKLGVPGVVTVIANEHVKNDDGSLTVNALHIKLLGEGPTKALGSGDIVLSSSTCGKATTPSGPGTGTPTPPSTSTNPAPPSTPAPAPGGGQVSQVPSGAPETGDGSLATSIVG